MKVAIYLFDNAEVLDFAEPFEVFSTASRVQLRLTPQADKPFEVFTITRTASPVSARGGLVVQPHFSFSKHPPVDMLIVSGGIVFEELVREQVTRWIYDISQTAQVTASVCTGSFLLVKAGLLTGKLATTYTGQFNSAPDGLSVARCLDERLFTQNDLEYYRAFVAIDFIQTRIIGRLAQEVFV